MAAEAVLDHVQPPQRQRVPDFPQEPVGFVGLQHIGEALAHQPLAIVVREERSTIFPSFITINRSLIK